MALSQKKSWGTIKSVKVAFFDAKSYDRTYFAESGHELAFFECRLTEVTASLARGFQAVCVFVNVLVTSHQGFLTHEALSEIARITCENFSRGNHGGPFLEGTELTT